MLGLLAKGGMAEIYLALAGDLTGFQTLVVVKRILPHLASNTDFIRMFFDEARIVAMLDHPNIVRIIEVGQDRDEYFLAMEVVQGKPLSALMRKAAKQNTPLTQAQSAYLVAQAANGLGYAHNLVDAGGRALNVVHRDVSPQNILVSYDGAVKVIDFGVARALGRASETRPGGLKGKIQYMAPEQAAAGQVDRRSDVFSLGVVLWEAMCGRRPFRRETDLETLRAIAEEPIPPPSRFVRISARLESIVMRALEKNPADRFQTAQEMGLALERFAFATQEFNPVQIAVTMKGLFAADFSRWKRTVSAAKELEGEPEQWVNTSGTYLRPQTIDLNTRGSTVALHPVPTPPPALVSTQELISDHRSIASAEVSWPYRRPHKRRLHWGISAGAALFSVVAVVVGIATWSNSPHETLARMRQAVTQLTPPRTQMRVEILSAAPVVAPAVVPVPSRVPAPAAVVEQAAPVPAVQQTTDPPVGDPSAALAAPRPRTPADDLWDGIAPTVPARQTAPRKVAAAGTKPNRRQDRPLPRTATINKTVARVQAQRVAFSAAASPSVSACSIRVGTRPWAEIWIDGKNTGKHTPYSERIDCGRHKLTFKRSDLDLSRTFAIVVSPGDISKQSFDLQ